MRPGFTPDPGNLRLKYLIDQLLKLSRRDHKSMDPVSRRHHELSLARTNAAFSHELKCGQTEREWLEARAR